MAVVGCRGGPSLGVLVYHFISHPNEQCELNLFYFKINQNKSIKNSCSAIAIPLAKNLTSSSSWIDLALMW